MEIFADTFWAILIVISLINIPLYLFRNAAKDTLGGKNPDKPKSVAEESSDSDVDDQHDESPEIDLPELKLHKSGKIVDYDWFLTFWHLVSQ